MNNREMKGREIANHLKIVHKGECYLVPSQSAEKTYTVRMGKQLYCNCPDFAQRGDVIGKCKHILAVEIKFSKQSDEFGNTVLMKTTSITYPQDWEAYDKSQTNEKDMFMRLLNDLGESIVEPIHDGAGRPSLPLRDVVFVSAMKVYTTFSLRRFVSDMRTAKEKGYIMWTPHYSRVARYMKSPELTPILQNLIKVSSLPLSKVETSFAVDSSGFSTSVFSRWFNFKYGRNEQERTWLKANIMIGTKTNVVTAVKLTECNNADTLHFPELVNQTADDFHIEEVLADKGYLSRDNFDLVDSIGGIAYIPFKRNATKKPLGSAVWKKMFHYFMLNQEEFMSHYHKRSNVEATFSMVKRKFGGSVRSKTETAQINEVLLKFLCHNICVVIQEMNELGIEVRF